MTGLFGGVAGRGRMIGVRLMRCMELRSPPEEKRALAFMV